METEAKFSFREPAAFETWRGRYTLGPFVLGPEHTTRVVDRYVDGPGQECLTGGYACRIRHTNEKFIATLKSLADAQPGAGAGVRRREELEVDLAATENDLAGDASAPLPDALQPEAWPESEARTLALRFLAGAKLQHLATLRQERHERDLLDRGRRLAVLSLDRVRFDNGRPEMLELEVELTDAGQERDLEQVVAVLRADAAFEPAPRSKLQRALEGMQGDTAGQAGVDAPSNAMRLFAAAAGLQHNGAAKRKGRRRTRAGWREALEFAELSEEEARDAATRAAIQPLAQVLDRLAAQGTTLAAIVVTERKFVVYIAGDSAANAAGAVAKAGALLEQAIGLRLRVEALPRDRRPPASLRFDQPLALAGRALLGALRDAMLAAEPGVRTGDAEALHDMRVAVRRMRTLLRLLRRSYPSGAVRPLSRQLKKLGASLGAVRDLDVLLERVAAESKAIEEQTDINTLSADWKHERDQARAALIAFLDSDRHLTVKRLLDGFIAATTAAKRGRARVCDAAPALVWRCVGRVRAYAPRLEHADLKQLHELRKQAKQLRYALEFFRPLLGSGTDAPIERIVAMQDALGALHDAAVLADRLSAWLDGKRSPTPIGVAVLHDLTLFGLADHRRRFEASWPPVQRRGFRRRLGKLLAGM